MRDGTRTLNDERSAAGASPRPFLFLALEAHQPTSAPARFSLSDVDVVTLGRGDARAFRRGERTLSIRLPDPWMSASHARLVRDGDSWVLEDLGSKNGTVLNGEAARKAPVSDGDLIETGRSFLILRTGLEARAADGGDVDASRVEPAARGLETLLPPLGERFARLAQIAASNVAVVIDGETGTGKELVARAIHALSKRRGPFVAVNCGAIPETLVESELFGHRAGAFSGATEDRPGLIRAADGGTLFLDEIGDLPLASQAAFLRALQEREVVPVGGVRPVRVDIRVVAATHRDLGRLVDEEAFRADLYARITGFQLRLPPLRERREDLGLIVATIIGRHARDRADRVSFDGRAARALFGHDWPLNVRELEKSLSAAIVLAGDRPISTPDLPGLPERPRLSRRASTPPAVAPRTDDELSAQLISLLREHRGSISAVARALGKDRKQIQRWLKRFRIHVDRFKGHSRPK